MIEIIEFESALTPLQMYRKLRKNFNYTFLLESMEGPEKFATQSILGFDPIQIIRIENERMLIDDREKTSGLENIVKQLNILLDMYKIEDTTNEYRGGLVGFTSYDIIRYKEKIDINKKSSHFPDALYGLYLDGIHVDHIHNKLLYFYHSTNKSRFEEIRKILEAEISNKEELVISEPKYLFEQPEFKEAVLQIKEGIKAGETFQTVISQRIDFEIKGDHIEIYEKLREINPSPYMYYLEFDDCTIIGSSPELLVSAFNRTVTTYPIAGTRPLGKTAIENQEIANGLLNDEKEIAEHNMLVDLARNDIGVIAEIGTVKVEEYQNIEYFSHVMHIVSKVVGKIKRNYSIFDAFFATFPAGTVSGAPKVRSMEIINKLEPVPRGPYAGSVGYFGLKQDMVQAITIRTAFGYKDQFSIQAGAGIVLDSDPTREYEETLHKLGALFKVLKSI